MNILTISNIIFIIVKKYKIWEKCSYKCEKKKNYLIYKIIKTLLIF